MPIILAHRRLRQEDHELKPSLGYIDPISERKKKYGGNVTEVEQIRQRGGEISRPEWRSLGFILGVKTLWKV
jgi:hypothetical protein